MHDRDLCGRVAPLLSALVDGEVEPGERALAEQAVRECDACAARADGLRLVSAALRSRASLAKPAPHLWPALTSRLDGVDRETRLSARMHINPVAWAAAVVLLVAVVWALQTREPPPLDITGLVASPSPGMAASLATDNLADAVRWADQRLGGDFTPVSLDSHGYQLTGVGVTEVNGAPAAVFVYGRGGREVRLYELVDRRRPLYGLVSSCPEEPASLQLDGPRGRLLAWLDANRVSIISGDLPRKELMALAVTCFAAGR